MRVGCFSFLLVAVGVSGVWVWQLSAHPELHLSPYARCWYVTVWTLLAVVLGFLPVYGVARLAQVSRVAAALLALLYMVGVWVWQLEFFLPAAFLGYMAGRKKPDARAEIGDDRRGNFV